MTRSWTDFWNQQSVFSDALWQDHIRRFVTLSAPILRYGPSDRVLDVGCGAGYLELELKDKVSEVWGLDTSQRFIDECLKRCKNVPNVHFARLPVDDYLNFAAVSAGRKFSIIICLSVIQYYSSLGDVEKLLQAVGKIAQPGAKLLIADIPVQGGFLRDVWGSLAGGLRNGVMIERLRLFLKARFSDYHQMRKDAGILMFQSQDLLRVAESLGLSASMLKGPLTLNLARVNLLITYP